MDTELLTRIQRLAVALGRVVDRDISKFPARIYSSEKGILFVQDFSGNATEAELSETLHGLISNVASFHDHLQKWALRHGVSDDSVHHYLKASFEYCVVRDLWNNDKHGYPPIRNDGWSGRAPKLLSPQRALRLATGTQANSAVQLTLDRLGRPKTTGDGSSEVIITAEVVDKHGAGLGDVEAIVEGAVSRCEAALLHFGVVSHGV